MTHQTTTPFLTTLEMGADEANGLSVPVCGGASEFKRSREGNYERFCAMKISNGLNARVRDLIFVGHSERLGRIYKYNVSSHYPSKSHHIGHISITDSGSVAIVEGW